MEKIFLWTAELTLFQKKWREVNERETSLSDDLFASWQKKHEELQKNPEELKKLMNVIKREHAIETGIIERMYEIDRGITETLIEKGFDASFLEHGDSNISKNQLIHHLQDHEKGIDMVFEFIKEEKPLSLHFIRSLHWLLLDHQEYIDTKNELGQMQKIKLLKGDFKKIPNNPKKENGETLMYCPPEQVQSEIEKIITIYNNLEKNEKIHPLIIASWFHHAFSIIHPFQDGNGRMARLLATLILIKHHYFPFTVLREEREKYFDALEKADEGNPASLVVFFANAQKKSIERALNFSSEKQLSSLSNIAQLLAEKLQEKAKNNEQKTLDRRNTIFSFVETKLSQFYEEIKFQFLESDISLSKLEITPFDHKNSYYYTHQIVRYAKTHNYFFLQNEPRAFFQFSLKIGVLEYKIVISLHHYGKDTNSLAIGGFVLSSEKKQLESQDNFENPYTISLFGESKISSSTEENISRYLEENILLIVANILKQV